MTGREPLPPDPLPPEAGDAIVELVERLAERIVPPWESITQRLARRTGLDPSSPEWHALTTEADQDWQALRYAVTTLTTSVADVYHQHGIDLETTDDPHASIIRARLAESRALLDRALAEIGIPPPPRGRRLPVIPDAFPNGRGLMSSGLAVHAVTRMIYAAIAGRLEINPTNGQPALQTNQRQGVGAVSVIALPSFRPTADRVAVSWDIARGFHERDVDMLYAIIGQGLHVRADSSGAFTITSAALLDYRGIDRVFTGERRHGHRVEDLRDVADSLGRLSSIWVELNNVQVVVLSKNGKRRRFERTTYEDGLLSIGGLGRKGTDGKGQPLVPVEWRIRFGRVLTEFMRDPNRQVAALNQEALKLDIKTRLPERRIAKYLSGQFKIDSAYQRPLTRRIGTILDEIMLDIPERNAARFRDRFYLALDRLKELGFIGAWSKSEPPDSRDLARRGWAQRWAHTRITMLPPPTLADASHILTGASSAAEPAETPP